MPADEIDVFLAHDAADREAASSLAKRLRGDGVSVTWDPRKLDKARLHLPVAALGLDDEESYAKLRDVCRERPAAQPFELRRIGLALSGGGFRAAAFHLGALSYLHHLGLTPRIRALSTVSGGTITGAAYLVGLIDGGDETQVLRDVYRGLDDASVMERTLGNLAAGSRTMVRGLAQTYDAAFFGDRTFGVIDDANSREDLHVEEICFNATEFWHALPFRFISSRGNARFGNGKLDIAKDDAMRLRLSDCVAASSCFPGGFEPILFPEEFRLDDDVRTRIHDALPKGVDPGPVPLMDGGIIDNLGVEGLIQADGRLERRDARLDLLLISDTDPVRKPFHRAGRTGWSGGGISLRWADIAIQGTCLVAAALILLSALSLVLGEGLAWYTVACLLALIGSCVATISGLSWVRQAVVTECLDQIPVLGRTAWPSLSGIGVADVVRMALLRVDSALAMTMYIFMYRIRALAYKWINVDTELRDRQVTCRIDEKPHRRARTPETAVVMAAARGMGTQLWFDNARQLPLLVQAGQLSICSNLRALIDDTQIDPALRSAARAELGAGLDADLLRFAEDPRWLVDHQALTARP